jgi:membrane protein YdbS with pleckstrin-like domain
MQRTDLIESMRRYDFGLSVSVAIVLAVASLALAKLVESDGVHRSGIADAISFVLFIGLVGIAIFLRFRNLRRLIKDLPPAETALKAGDGFALSAAQLPKPAILLMTVLGLLGCIGAVTGLLHEWRSGEWMTVSLLVVAAAGSRVIAWYYAQIWRHRVK